MQKTIVGFIIIKAKIRILKNIIYDLSIHFHVVQLSLA